MDPLGIIGNGQGYRADQQRQAATLPALPGLQQGGSQRLTGVSGDGGEPKGITLPEDQVSLSGARPEQKEPDGSSGGGGDAAAATAGVEGRDAAGKPEPGEKTATDGRSIEDPEVKAQIQRLKQNEDKVKAHEAAHKAVGGSLAGSVSYSYTQGPDGRSYISGGEVQIDMSGGRTPQETISKMQQVIRAALAPADPSGQDRAVASQAASQLAQAQQEKLQADNPATDNGSAPAGEENAAAGAAGRTSAANGEAGALTEQPASGAGRQAERAYGESSVQGRAVRSDEAPSDAATVMGLFRPSFRGISSYA